MKILLGAAALVLCLASTAHALDKAPFIAKLGKYALPTSPPSDGAKALCICREPGNYDGTAGRLVWYQRTISSYHVIAVGCFVARFYPSDDAPAASQACTHFDVLAK